jgi:hypothetical protein
MEERISMSQNDLYRLQELQKVHEKRQTLAQAAQRLDLSLRQVKRLSKRLKAGGPKGIISKRIGKPSNHRLPVGLEGLAIGLIKERYRDFGPTLAHEYLVEKHGLSLSISSVRNIMIRDGLWEGRARRRARVFQLRPRRAREGELIQMDGSEHDWFEGRGPRCTLLSYIDDATSAIKILRFVKSENLVDYLETTRAYIERYGRPEALYPDKHAVFRVNREGALSGNGMTQFGRAMEELGIQLICANTPQAKGRVERRHRDLQDRLIKAMRLEKIDTLKEANAFLPSFIDDFNRRFAKSPQDTNNAHMPALPSQDLDRIFCLKTPRQLSKNLTLQYKNVIYQIITERPSYAMKKAMVDVMESKDGTIRIEYQGKPLTWVPYHQQQARVEVISSKEIAEHLGRKKSPYHPPRRHPWKRGRRGFSSKQEVLLVSR